MSIMGKAEMRNLSRVLVGIAKEILGEESNSLESLYKGEMDFDGSDKWKKQHTTRTKGGSFILGTPHTGGSKSEERYIGEVVKDSSEYAAKAIKSGKKVVFLAEDTLDEDGMPWEGSEQRKVADALKEIGGKNVTIESWDEGVEVLDKQGKKVDTKSNGFRKMLDVGTSDDSRIEAGIFAFMVGQGAELETISDEAKLVLEKSGMDLPKDFSDIDDELREQLYRLAFPEDDKSFNPDDMTDDQRDFWHISLAYNRMREDNLKQKIKEHESNGCICVVTPGASHAYALSKVNL